VFKPDEETAKYLKNESIFYENNTPKFNEESIDRELMEVDLILLQAHTFYNWRTLPRDEHREEILRPFVQLLTKKESKKDWLMDTNSLLLRSRNDFERTKGKEQSLIYFSGLLESFRN
jgi:hypothetical protein